MSAYTEISRYKTMAYKFIHISLSNDDKQNIPSVDYNLELKHLDNQPKKPTMQNLISSQSQRIKKMFL